MQKIRLKSIPQFVRRHKTAVRAFFIIVIISFLTLVVMSIAPSDFPRNTIIRINKDMTVSSAASMLKEKGIIKSAYLYKVYIVVLHNDKGIQAGSYLFDEPQSVLKVAYRTAYGVTDLHKIKVTIFEGSNSKEIANIIKKAIPLFDKATFLTEARKSEGYLFPETYFFNPDVRPDEVISMMRQQFDEKISEIANEIATSTHEINEIITMASILEEEANNTRDRVIISGILWKRIEKGMLLQVDAPFYYLFGKGSSQITRTDLATTSPYNTYVHKGLPIAPISNPGLDAIKAALFPNKNPYYFYLADRSGVTHYAVNHDGHVANKEKYLQ